MTGDLVARYANIEHLFPDTLKDGALPYFIAWLKEKVELIQITAYSDDAYVIFESSYPRHYPLRLPILVRVYVLAAYGLSIRCRSGLPPKTYTQ